MVVIIAEQAQQHGGFGCGPGASGYCAGGRPQPWREWIFRVYHLYMSSSLRCRVQAAIVTYFGDRGKHPPLLSSTMKRAAVIRTAITHGANHVWLTLDSRNDCYKYDLIKTECPVGKMEQAT